MGVVITFITDFGLSDTYAAVMKGVILGINPDANLVDICHSIEPQNIVQAAYVLNTSYQYFPERTVHLAVVDPGVGTERKAVILRTPDADFVAPDNGVLDGVIRRYSDGQPDDNRQQLRAGVGLKAVAITNPQFWRAEVSRTFHGRDIFAPVAAHLSLGTPLADFGESLDSLTVLPSTRPYLATDGALVGRIIHVDRFGNLITNIESRDLPEDASNITVEVGDKIISGLSVTYGDGEGLLALIGSNGYLEISLKDGNAGAFMSAGTGDEVTIRKTVR